MARQRNQISRRRDPNPRQGFNNGWPAGSGQPALNGLTTRANNDFTIALNLTSQANATVPVVVSKFANDYEVLHSQMAAASILATLPALLMFVGQRFIIQGLRSDRRSNRRECGKA